MPRGLKDVILNALTENYFIFDLWKTKKRMLKIGAEMVFGFT